LYKTYGEDYKQPCSRYVIDALNDFASKFNASLFFKGVNTISPETLKELKPIMLEKCFFKVTTLQLSTPNLPGNYQ